MNNPHPQRKRGLKALSIVTGEAKESLFMAMGSLAAHKLRSALTLLGILVGVFSIIFVMTVMRAMERDISANLSRLGANSFVVQTWGGLHFDNGRNDQKYWRRKRITLAQGLALQNRATLPRNIGLEDGLASGNMTSPYSKGPPNVSLTGETPGSFPVQDWVIEEGRALVDSDVDGQRDVCVLGNSLAKDLFPFGSAIGGKVQFDGIDYTVVGVLEAKGSMEGGRQDNFAILPITTGLTRYQDRRWEDVSILVQARSAADYEDTMDQVRGLLRLIRKVPPAEDDNFEITSNDSLMSEVKSFTFKLRMGISIVSSIALLAAGIGIMNIMLVSVTERTREIGIRRAIGARKRNIMTQFIMEAIVLCEVGGAIGVALGIFGGDIGAHFMNLHAVVPVDWVMIGLGICSLVGIIFGAYPAFKAANLDPIESLRYE